MKGFRKGGVCMLTFGANGRGITNHRHVPMDEEDAARRAEERGYTYAVQVQSQGGWHGCQRPGIRINDEPGRGSPDPHAGAEEINPYPREFPTADNN